MMQGDRHSQYKGFDVTVRWTELARPPKTVGKRFTASYLVEVAGQERGLWHNLPDDIFHTHDTASAFARREARRTIDSGPPRLA
jgi:hypothetical protein